MSETFNEFLWLHPCWRGEKMCAHAQEDAGRHFCNHHGLSLAKLPVKPALSECPHFANVESPPVLSVWKEEAPTKPGVYDHWCREYGYTRSVRVSHHIDGTARLGLNTEDGYTDVEHAHALEGSRWRRTGDLS